jgi:hypothetical protein
MGCHQAVPSEQAAWHRRVLNGIFWVLRSGAPWRDLPETYGPAPLAIIASFVGAGWRMGPDHGCPAAGHEAAVQMIDTSVVRMHQTEG